MASAAPLKVASSASPDAFLSVGAVIPAIVPTVITAIFWRESIAEKAVGRVPRPLDEKPDTCLSFSFRKCYVRP
jgi:hypothetical protein